MNNGGNCVETQYTTKSTDTPIMLDGGLSLDFNPPYDLLYLWCACPDPTAQVHFEYQSSPFP